MRMADNTNVEATVKRIIVEKLDLSDDQVTMEAKFIDDLGADSLDQTELLMALEEEFNVDIDDDANEIATVGDAVNYIKSKL
jgi:acyl carrier protein